VPTTSFTYRTVGIVLTITPAVSFDGEIILDVVVESSSQSANINVNGQSLPSFGTRKAQSKLRMRDGESNLLAGLIKDEDRRTDQGFPGINRIPFLRSIFGGSKTTVGSSDIVMIITPRILRSQELTPADLAPMYVGTGTSFGASTTPQLIVPQPVSSGTTPPAPAPAPATAPNNPAAAPTNPAAGAPTSPATPPPGAGRAVGIVPVTSPDAPTAPPAAAPGPLRVSALAPATQMQMGGPPYTVPLTLANAAGLTSLTLSVTYNPAVLKATVVNEGSMMRSDGASTSFVPKIDPNTGRIDLAITRPGDKVGVGGAGLLATITFEAIGAGNSQIALSGLAMNAAGQAVLVQFVPAAVTVK
jgi:general secretion pathway protein D